MNLEKFRLAATTNDLTREMEAREHADLIEFRMDTAEDPIGQLREYEGELPLIATNRTRWFGGKANDSGRLDKLFEASRHSKVEFVDIEFEVVRGLDWIANDLRQNNVQLIISHHDFKETPEKRVLDEIFEQCFEYGDLAKVAVYPESIADSHRLLGAINKATEQGRDVAGISMGSIGSYTRLTAPLYGSKMGYAPLASDNNNYAPGQVPLEKLATMVDYFLQKGAEAQVDMAQVEASD